MENYAASPEADTPGYIQNAQRDARTPVYEVPGTATPKGGYDPFGRPVPNPTARVRSPELQPQPWVRQLQRFLGRNTYGSLRVDLARPTLVPRSMQRREPEQYNVYGETVSKYPRAGGQRAAGSRQGASGYGGVTLQRPDSVLSGARIKVMRCAGWGPVVPFSYAGRKAFDAGIGLNLDLQGAGIAPSLRLRVIEAVRLHVLPRPVFKLKHAFPLFDTGLALHAAFYQPMEGQKLRHVGRTGAWNVSLGRVGANQVIVSPDRIELSNTNFQLGRMINLHLNGEIAYPRYLPDPDWMNQFNFLPNRVCLKVDW